MSVDPKRIYNLGTGVNFDDEGFVASFWPHPFDAGTPNKIKRFQWVDIDFRSEVGGDIQVTFIPDHRPPKAVTRQFSLAQAGRQRMVKRVSIGLLARVIQVAISATVGGSNDYLVGREVTVTLSTPPQGVLLRSGVFQKAAGALSSIVDESGNYVGAFDSIARAETHVVDESDNNLVDENGFKVKGAGSFARMKIYTLVYGYQEFKSVAA